LAAAFFKQVSDRAIGSSGFGSETNFAGSVGRDTFAAGSGQGRMNFAQGMGVKFGDGKTAIPAKAAAMHTGRFHNLLSAGLQQAAQLGIRGAAAHAAIDMQRITKKQFK
jgi:hypothetical protein